jgi:hypothetical protein
MSMCGFSVCVFVWECGFGVLCCKRNEGVEACNALLHSQKGPLLKSAQETKTHTHPAVHDTHTSMARNDAYTSV